ncbi:MAG TPA: phosphatidate cytidylyltransferase [Steroidobacteraceae bacterium]|nr:phosphatidate cytidylyltransferase [Steroidobacteraceae bacterium]
MIGALLSVSVPGFALGALGMALASRRATREQRRGRWLKFAVFCAIVHAVLGAAALGTAAIRLLYLGIVLVCGAEFARAFGRIAAPRPWPAAALAALLAAGAVAGTLRNGAAVLVWCFVVIACADGFAQVVGQLWGRRPLAPRLSPAKTLEGALGGLAAAVTGSGLLHGVVALPAWAAAGWGAALAAAGLGGDLAASWVKRRAGLKDYSPLLPGQGGFLDRFDSLLGALALLAAAWPAPP